MRSASRECVLPYGHMSNVEVLHVVGTLHVVVHCSSSCASEGFNGVDVAFLREEAQIKHDRILQF